MFKKELIKKIAKKRIRMSFKEKEIHLEDLDIRLSNGDLVSRKFWEVRKIEHEEN